jgi:hypothetical protein
MRVSKSTNVLFAAALMLPSLAFWSQARSTAHDRDVARSEAEHARQEAQAARLAANKSTELNESLQTRLTCRGRLAEAIDVAIASILLKVTAGGPADLTEDRQRLQVAMDARAQTQERCGG